MGRVRTAFGLWVFAELVVFLLAVQWVGLSWTILATLATSALGVVLLGKQGTRALGELRERARTRRAPARALGDAGLVALGGLLMLLPGFLGDLFGLLCLLPATRMIPRALAAWLIGSRLPIPVPVRVRSSRAGSVRGAGTGYSGATASRHVVIDGEVAEPAGMLQVESRRLD